MMMLEKIHTIHTMIFSKKKKKLSKFDKYMAKHFFMAYPSEFFYNLYQESFMAPILPLKLIQELSHGFL